MGRDRRELTQNTIDMKRNKWMAIVSLATVLWTGTACTSDLTESLPEVSNIGLAIGFDTGKGGFTTRAEVADDSSLREDHVDHVDVFIFDGVTGGIVPNGTGTCYWRVTASEMEENQTQTQTLLDGDWKTSPLNGSDYDVYVVANLHDNGNLSDVKSVADLQAKVEEDANVYQAQGGIYGGNTPVQDKLFTMTGKVENFNPQVITEDEYVLPVTLTRVAAKIQIEVKLSEDFLQNVFTPHSFTQQLKNYAPTAYLLEGRDEDHTYEPTSSTGYTPARTSNVQAGTATFVLYTYPTEWTADVLRETYVIVNIPGDRKNPPEGEQPYTGSNYYKIPLRAVADAKLLERNHIYRVKATVDMMGTYTPDEPVPLKTVEYEVARWKTENVDITGDNPAYLVLNEHRITMKNIEDYADLLKFTSSSAVHIVPNSIEAYYYDAEGVRQDVSNRIENEITITPDGGLSGFIDIHSPIPTNNGIRFIKFTVENEQNISQDVIVKQYPLEYITFVDGWFSYRDDFGGTTFLNEGNHTTSNGTFQSKVWENNQIKTYSWRNGGRRTSYYNAGTHNNKMYHIVITKTSDEYTLAIPTKDANGDTNDQDSHNTNVVSPSFMLASRLGLVSNDDYNFAKEHCRNYVETVRDGNTNNVLYKYDDWRLPTKAELMIIDRFQNTEGSVIITILNKSEQSSWPWGGGSNAYYWGAGGRYRTNYDGVTTSQESQWDSSIERNDNAYIRCIRDVKYDEPINSEPEE